MVVPWKHGTRRITGHPLKKIARAVSLVLLTVWSCTAEAAGTPSSPKQVSALVVRWPEASTIVEAAGNGGNSGSDTAASNSDAEKPGASAAFEAVEAFVARQPTRSQLLKALKHPQSHGLESLAVPPVLQCESYPSIRLYDEYDARKASGKEGLVDLGNLHDVAAEFGLFVSKHRVQQELRHKKMLQLKSHRRLGVGVVQWNTFMMRPSAVDLLWALMDGVAEHKATPVDRLDVLVFLLHETPHFKTKTDKRRMLKNVQHVVNVLSTEHSWGAAHMKSLKNTGGTGLRFGRLNTQSIIWISRFRQGDLSSPHVNYVCLAQHAVNGREKGFIAAVLHFTHVGKLAFVGVHLPGWESQAFRSVIAHLVEACGNKHKGLDSFDGVFIGGDWNEHLNTDALLALYSTVESSSGQTFRSGNGERGADVRVSVKLHATRLFLGLLFVVPEAAPQNRVAKALTEAMLEGPERVSRVYMPLLWAVDRFGRMPRISKQHPTTKREEPVVAVLRDMDFDQATACYKGGWTYKYTPEHLPKAEAAHPFLRMTPCIHKKVLLETRGVGFLDRSAMRMSKAAGADGWPEKAAFIVVAKQVFVHGTDHSQQFTALDILYRF
ncbi:hypothetical protein cyc_00561 [Cyclospora cayetanensis]|uniref:Endonuclease/exonuclease/phosphatase domain-containing protein n=1 Tax=Cyclospora cayetanensis TaxID=88456 RepID=A0A1D3D3C8_9EIME|nr:hypothetical protein cyc_00561 [Cyclospora cayetanensis]